MGQVDSVPMIASAFGNFKSRTTSLCCKKGAVALIALETTTYLRALPAAISGTLGFSHEKACGQCNRAGKEKI
jgi:hypothetical protein